MASEEEIVEESFYEKDMFADELKQIQDEIQALDDLYDEVKTHYDAVKNSPSRGSLTFLEKQTTNLINLKNAKLNFIKEGANMKRTTTDFAYKEKQIKTKEGVDGDLITQAIYKKIADDFIYNSAASSKEELESVEDEKLDDELLDEELDNILEENGIVDLSEVSDSETHDITVQDGYFLAFDDNTGKFYNVSDDLEEAEEIEVSDTIIDTVEEDEDTYAVGESGNRYLMIEID